MGRLHRPDITPEQLPELGAASLKWFQHGMYGLLLVVGGPLLLLTNIMVGGTYLDNLFTFVGPGWVRAASPWALSVTTSVIQILLFRYLMVTRRSKEQEDMRFTRRFAFAGMFIIGLANVFSDLGGVTQLIYPDGRYANSVIPPISLMEPKWILGTVLVGGICLMADPIIAYMVPRIKDLIPVAAPATSTS